jgi:hypothetical protein
MVKHLKSTKLSPTTRHFRKQAPMVLSMSPTLRRKLSNNHNSSIINAARVAAVEATETSLRAVRKVTNGATKINSSTLGEVATQKATITISKREESTKGSEAIRRATRRKEETPELGPTMRKLMTTTRAMIITMESRSREVAITPRKRAVGTKKRAKSLRSPSEVVPPKNHVAKSSIPSPSSLDS